MAAKRCLLLLLLVIAVLEARNQRLNMLQVNKDEYLRLRNNMIGEEYQMRLGGKLKLSDSERQVNDILMTLKAKELDSARENVTNFPPAVHFFRAKALIDKSEVFRMIRNMPKGKFSQFMTPITVKPGGGSGWTLQLGRAV